MLKLIFVLIFTLQWKQEVVAQKLVKKCCPKDFVLDSDSLICVPQQKVEMTSNITLIPSHSIDISIKDFYKSLKISDFQENDLSFEMGKQFYVLWNNTLIMLKVI
jgi:hypothetical protein